MKKPAPIAILAALLFVLPAPLFGGGAEGHLIGDEAYRQEIRRLLAGQEERAGHRRNILFGVLRQEMPPDEREALEFLLAAAPLCDLADCDGAFFREIVQTTLRARREMPWGRRIPAEIFRHFVLPPRVNNENLDRFRPVMYEEIKARVQGLALAEAALEINHWCHEKVVYQGTDERTSAPLDTVRTAFGRCGEESTFTVAALRTAGIPARQCYTPRWAHVDDNHAWVEVWVDGQWHYLGACEPEETLDKAWFDGPVKRAMLVHTRAYGPYRGDEEVLRRGERFAELNLLARYTRTAPLTVTVVDDGGQPAPGAVVRFQLYNYAEFFTLSRQVCDAAGQAAFRTGLGDLLVWADRGDRYGFARVRAGEQASVTIALDRRLGDSYSLDLDFTPPAERETPDRPTDDNSPFQARLRREDGIRNRYVGTFIGRKQSDALARRWGVDGAGLYAFLKASRGNGKEIRAFLEEAGPAGRDWALRLLGTLSEKDLRDAPRSVLLAHLRAALAKAPPPARPDGLFLPCVLNPRVANEWLRPYRQEIRQALPAGLAKEAGADPGRLAAWIDDNIRLLDDDDNYCRTPLSPTGVLALRAADRRSRDIFAVALCRSLGLPARLAAGSGRPEANPGGGWRPLWPPPAAPTARLRLQADPAETTTLRYGGQFTLAKWQDGAFETLAFPDDTPLSDLASPLALPPGSYRLLTGLRLFNDDILTAQAVFSLPADGERDIPVKLRAVAEQFRGSLTLPPGLPVERIGRPGRVGMQSLVPGQGAVLCFLRPNHEPSRHLLDDLSRIRRELQEWGGPVIVVIKDRREEYDLRSLVGDKLPPNRLVVRIPADQAAFTPRFSYPLCALVDSRLAVRYQAEGYRVGSDAQLLRAVRQLPCPAPAAPGRK